MSTRLRVQREYILDGVVVERLTQRGVRGVRVDAWDRDVRYPDLLGQAVTDEQGRFAIAFDGTYFRDYDPERAPDLFFRVYRDDVEVLSTFDRPQKNLQRGTTQVRLELDEPALPPLGKDRVSAAQAIKAIDWWQASDFRGVFRQGKDKATSVGTLTALVATRAFERFDFEPVKPSGAQERDIVNQDQDSARRALARNEVEVTGVKPVSALSSREGLKTAAGYPARLRPGDKVTLYEESGVVRFYTRDAQPEGAADSATVERIDGDVQAMKARMLGVDDLRVELANVRATSDEATARAAEEAERSREHDEELERVRRELDEVRQASATKDAEIEKLKRDLTIVRGAQDDLATRIPLDRLRALELAIERLNRGGGRIDRTGPGGMGPSAARSAGKSKAKKGATKKSSGTRKRPRRGPE